MMQSVRNLSARIETLISKSATPLKPAIPVIARFLLVVTFFEDSLRIITQWTDQLVYLENYRGFYHGTNHAFLGLNVFIMCVGSAMVIMRKRTEYAVGGLFGVVVSQTVGYGLFFDFNFFLRNVSILGGLLMLLADSINNQDDKRRTVFPGLPTISYTNRSTYIQLAGRILLIFLFMSFVFAGEMTPLRIAASAIGLVASAMVVIGFKAKFSALFLVLFLSVFNVIINNWWTIHHNHPTRDFVMYDFFQTLSIMGGLLLLVNLGPGGLSVDEKKKNY
ncbi:SURF4-domain-containing protein [Basidiobolus meristosporus CBS 931.73]|uniref:SURF4-domain-containing protein n=1 Tax=Basidiobolus meristosporus CBS 931.73 TaxID=1314790 RepID=A0A1Y1Z4J0_9FUNG|nr:SURF4-domain-containing protein [Basidiobolus meristosporus CBS 931.73]|eukprot:ORY05034.1 SURF4-domain-containing protein [Basidiobolus meristosporus CBS 931.73]